MAPEQRFKDEWLVRLVKALPQFPVEFIERARASRSPYLAQALVAAGLLQPEEIGRIVEQAYRIRYLAPSRQDIDKSALRLVPERLCRSHMLLPVGASDRSIDVAMANPLDPAAQQDVGNVTGRAVKAFYCSPGRVDELLARVLTPDQVIYDLLERVEQRDRVELVEEPADDRDGAPEPVRDPVVQLVDAILARAVQVRASDIHIEQEERQTNVRYRVDGLLRNSMVLPRYVGVGPVVSRIKIIAKLDVADRRRPQDGRAKIRVGQAEVGLRVSTLPTALGEKVVIRILDERTAFIPLDKLGFNDTLRVRLEGLMRRGQGILLVTGPTGSGKTSTLYAIASALLSEDTNIVTVEDPIEFRLKGVNQVQVSEKAGLTFASVLRSVLRQDPDIILVGEIRDRETADIACQAALTGHLVLSTLHTNDALGSVTRLVDMGVDRYKIAAGVIGVAAQRLARRLCPECRQPLPDDQIPDRLRSAMRLRSIAPRAFGPHGCEACDYAGYRGRVPLFELLEITPAVRDAIAEGAAIGDVRLRALRDGALHLLTDDALAHVAAGDITIDEATPHLQLEPAPASAAAGSRTQAGPEPAARVLVALSGEAARQAAAAALAGGGCVVETAADGPAALISLAQRPPDALLVELDLPVLDGLELIRRARTGMALSALPILAASEADDVERRAAALAAGADDVIALAAGPGAVAARMRGMLERRGDYSPTSDIMRPRIPANEDARLAALRATGVLDTPPEERFDALTRLAQQTFRVPIAMVSLVDADRQWFKSKVGVDANETPRDVAFCAHAINGAEVFVVQDAELDPRFAENPLVRGEPHVRFYAGYPLNGPNGEKLGSFCIIDHKPRQMTKADIESLTQMGRLVERALAATRTPPALSAP